MKTSSTGKGVVAALLAAGCILAAKFLVFRLLAGDRGVAPGLFPGFFRFFRPMDLLWFGLAVFTAYRVGVGSYGSN